MTRWLAAGAVFAGALLAGVCWNVQGDDGPVGKDAVRAFMRGKLDSSRDVLEGLVTEDFALIENGADRMRSMSKKAQWNSIKTDRYLQYSQEFQRATEQLAKAGREKKIDAAALSWTQVTLCCVNCHRYARDVAMAGSNAPEDRLMFASITSLENER